MNLNKNKRAFTLIELLIVIAIIGILFIVLVSKVDFATDKAKATGVQTDFRSFQVAFDTVAQENAGFNTFGYNTGDNAGAIPAGYAFETTALKDATIGDGIRNSYDQGDKNLNGKQDTGEVFTGRKIYTETWTEVYTLVKPGTTGFDANAVFALESAINANLDPKLHITINTADGTITMANQARDPWKNEYHGVYISNAAADGMDRGAIIIYSNGANGKWGSAHDIANGVVSVTVPGNNKDGQDDMSMVVVYTYENGYGKTDASTSGFSNNQGFLSNNLQNVGRAHLVGSGSTYYAMAPTVLTFKSSVENGAVVKVLVDGVELDVANYTISNNAVVLSVNYLASLAAGEYEISIEFEKMILTGNFGVFLPMKNEDGFFYNQPYAADVPYLGGWTIFVIREDNTLDAMVLIDTGGSLQIATEKSYYTIDGSLMTVYSASVGDLHMDLTGDGYSMYNYELGATFTLNNDNIVADSDYFYLYNSYLGGYEALVIDKTKSNYGAIRTGINGIDTVAIADYGFANCTKMTSAPSIPDTVVKIGDSAFKNCLRMTGIQLPQNLIVIGYSAFADTSLYNVTIPRSVTTIGELAFFSVKNLSNVVFEDGIQLQEISGWLFMDCIDLKQISIPDSVTALQPGAFVDSGLTTFTISKNITEIAESAFDRCALNAIYVDPENTSFICENNTAVYNSNKTKLVVYALKSPLTTYTVPVNIDDVSEMRGAYNLSSILVESGNASFVSHDGILFSITGEVASYPANKAGDTYVVETGIQPFAFKYVRNLRTLVIPDSVRIQSYAHALASTGSIENFVVNDTHPDVYALDGHLISKDGMYLMSGRDDSSGVVIVPGIPTILETSFAESDMHTLVFSEGTEIFEINIVYGNDNLTTIVLPSTLVYFGGDVFSGCNNLSNVVYNGTVEQWNNLVELSEMLDWFKGTNVTQIQCSDGVVYL